MIKQTLPLFQLKDQYGRVWSHNDFIGFWSLIFVYPKDDTPGCTIENQNFSNLISKFTDLDVRIFGLSPDRTDTHHNFCKKYALKQILLSDPLKELILALGAWGEKKNYGKSFEGLIRSTFLIDPSGRICKEWKNVRAKGHARRVLDELSMLVKAPV